MDRLAPRHRVALLSLAAAAAAVAAVLAGTAGVLGGAAVGLTTIAAALVVADLLRREHAELAAHNADLAAAHEDARATGLALAEATERLSSIVHTSADGILYISAEGLVEEWSAGAERMLRVPRAEAIGVPAYHLLGKEAALALADRLKEPEAVDPDDPIDVLMFVPRGDGTRMLARIIITPITRGERGPRAGWVAVLRDATRTLLAQSASRLGAHLEAGSFVSELGFILRQVTEFDALTVATIEDGSFQELATFGHREARPPMEGVISQGGLEALARDQPFVVNDTTALELPVAVALRRMGILSGMMFPLVESGDPVGALVVGYRQKGRADQAVTELISLFVPIATQAVKAIRLHARETQARVRLETLDRLQRDFLRMVAHELRGPLAAITLAADAMAGQGDRLPPDKRAALAEGIATSARRLSKMVGDVLEVGRMEAGDFPHEPVPVSDLGETINAAVAEVAMETPDRTITVDVGALGTVVADPPRIAQVVRNLTSNAARYAGPGTNVAVRAWREDDSLEIAVADQGPGIPADEREHVFERFVRLNGETGPDGTGLGLYICRAIVRRHGGRIWVTDGNDGRGSTFRVAIPQPLSA